MNSLLKNFKGWKIGLDTMIFIYAFEEYPIYLPSLKDFFLSLEKGEIEAVTSTLTITECLIQPYRKKDLGLVNHYLILFRNFPHLSIKPVTEDIAQRGAFLRAHYNLRTPDAIAIATALYSGCHAFLTNDASLPLVEGIQLILLDRLR